MCPRCWVWWERRVVIVADTFAGSTTRFLFHQNHHIGSNDHHHVPDPGEPIHGGACSWGHLPLVRFYLSAKTGWQSTLWTSVTITNIIIITFLCSSLSSFYSSSSSHHDSSKLTSSSLWLVRWSRQVTDSGKTAMFNCTVSGFPVLNVYWWIQSTS